ncbi:MAG: guanylate kinase [Oscillospiraceae bacterium]|nr:guanylate kinase [Oscillospiraceae bacterium]
MSKGNLFVISGASGVGKSTVLAKVMAARDDLQFSVSATTRPPRPGEIEGKSYYFVSHQQFEQMIAEDAFVEYDCHMANCYGTPTRQLEEKLVNGSVILDIEPVGAGNVRKKRPDATLIFIAPPSMEELERRLRGRGDTAEDQIQLRLDRAKWEMDQTGWYDHIVINDQVDTCADKILSIIAQKCDAE